MVLENTVFYSPYVNIMISLLQLFSDSTDPRKDLMPFEQFTSISLGILFRITLL